MHITILDGDPRGPDTPLDRALAALVAETAARGDACQRVRLAGMNIHQCVGCFACWLKTPGRCRLKDDGAQVVGAIVVADLVVFASPMRMGFTNSLLKRATDRMLPILLPYIQVIDGECHHVLRYGHPLDLALMVERGDCTDEDVALTERIYARLAKNVHGRLAWTRVVDKGAAHAMVAA